MIHPKGFHELVGRAQAGDRYAIDHLLATIRPLLEQLARAYSDPRRPDESASDLVQKTCFRVWEKLDQFQGSEDDDRTLAMFDAWVRQIVRRMGLNTVRSRRAQRHNSPGEIVRLDATRPGGSTNEGCRPCPAAADPTPSANAAANEQIRRTNAALEAIIDDTDREIVRLRFFEGLSLRQIAEHLGHNREDVRRRFHAAMRFLEQRLEGFR